VARKKFFCEQDRAIVGKIARDYVLKRRLAEAIKTKSRAEATTVLQELDDNGLQDFLDQPVDRSLNTFLHKAVANRFEAELRAAAQGPGPGTRARPRPSLM